MTSDVDLGNLDLDGGYRAPIRGVLTVPTNTPARGSAPLVLIGHLRGPGCSNGAEQYPCPRGAAERRYDRGMQWLAQRLSERGYAVLVPDLAPVYIPRGTGRPYRQDAAVAAVVERFVREIGSGGKTLGVDTGRVATQRMGVIAHSRSGLVADHLARAWAKGPHPVVSILAYGPTYSLPRTSGDNSFGPPHPDIPYYSLQGSADADTDTESVEHLTHHLTQRRSAPAFVQTVRGFGHNYVNRALSSIRLDDRTDCSRGCPTPADHESLLGQAATSWLAVTMRGQSGRLPVSTDQIPPARMFAQEGRWLAVSNDPRRVSLLAGSRAERPATSAVTTRVCRFQPPMAPPAPGVTYCDDSRIGSFAAYDVALRRIAWRSSGHVRWSVPAPARNTGVVALQLGPGEDLPAGRAGTPVRLTFTDTSGARFTTTVSGKHPALMNRKTAQSNGIYQVGTVRIRLDDVRGWARGAGQQPRPLASVQLGGTGLPGVLILRSVDLIPR